MHANFDCLAGLGSQVLPRSSILLLSLKLAPRGLTDGVDLRSADTAMPAFALPNAADVSLYFAKKRTYALMTIAQSAVPTSRA